MLQIKARTKILALLLKNFPCVKPRPESQKLPGKTGSLI